MRIVSMRYDDTKNVFINETTENAIDDVSKLISYDELVSFKAIGGIYYHDDIELNTRYEIIFPINDIDRTLYYDVKENIMYDEYGAVMHNVFSIVDSNTLHLFKKGKKTVEVRGILGGTIELVWYGKK